MAAMLVAFLLWLFATGKYSDWLALVQSQGKTAQWSGSSNQEKTSTDSANSNGSTNQAPPVSELVKTGSDWLNSFSGLSNYDA